MNPYRINLDTYNTFPSRPTILSCWKYLYSQILPSCWSAYWTIFHVYYSLLSPFSIVFLPNKINICFSSKQKRHYFVGIKQNENFACIFQIDDFFRVLSYLFHNSARYDIGLAAWVRIPHTILTVRRVCAKQLNCCWSHTTELNECAEVTRILNILTLKHLSTIYLFY